MLTREEYRKMIETDFELGQAKLAEFKARGKNLTADARIKHAKLVDDLEQKSALTKTKLKELCEANEDVWEKHKEGVESTWGALQAALKDTVIMFEKDV
jgi:hypothetical protein